MTVQNTTSTTHTDKQSEARRAHKPVSIWFFVGILLLIYGALILAAGLTETAHVVLANLHVGIWWGAVLLVLGAIYTIVFAPGRRKR